MYTGTNTRSPKAVWANADEVAKMLKCSREDVIQADQDGMMPSSVNVLGNRRWRVIEIRQWSREGCPDRETWERLKYHR
jgi:hypothetical protein